MKFTVETLEMNWVLITFENGDQYFYDLNEMNCTEAIAKAINQHNM